MTSRQIELATNRHRITLYVNSPSGVEPIDDYREVNFELPGRGWYRAVFFLLPDKNADDPDSITPRNQWDVPVRWDDPTMLYVPALNDDSVLAAMRYIIDNDKQGDAFENEDEIQVDAPHQERNRTMGCKGESLVRFLVRLTSIPTARVFETLCLSNSPFDGFSSMKLLISSVVYSLCLVLFLCPVLAAFAVPLSYQDQSPTCVNTNPGFDSGLTGWQIYKGPGIEDSAKVESRERSNDIDSRHVFVRLPSNSRDNPTQYVKIGQYLPLKKGRRYRYTVDVKWLNTENSLKSAIVSAWAREQQNGTFAGKDVWLRSGATQTLTFNFSPTADGIVDCYLSLLTHQDGFDNTDILIDDFEIQDVGPLVVDEDLRPRKNLIVNGDFETSLNSWRETTNNPLGLTGLEKRATNLGSNNVLQLELPGADDPDLLNDTWIGLYQPVKLFSGNTYTISAKISRLIPSTEQYPTIVNLYAVKPETQEESAHWLGSVDYKFNRSDSHVYTQQFTPLVTGEYHVTIRVFGWGNNGKPLKVQFDDVVLKRQ